MPLAHLTVGRPLHLGSIVTGHWGLDLSNMLWPIAARIGLPTSTGHSSNLSSCLLQATRLQHHASRQAMARQRQSGDYLLVGSSNLETVLLFYCFILFPRTFKFCN